MRKRRAEPLEWSAQRAFSRLLARLNRSELSPLEARRYLSRAGCPEPLVSESVSRAEELGYLSAERCQESLMRKAVYKKWSQIKLQQQGSVRGVEVAQELDESAAIEQLARRWAEQKVEPEKIRARLQRRGFRSAAIREVLRNLL